MSKGNMRMKLNLSGEKTKPILLTKMVCVQMKDQICSSSFEQINRQAILWTWIDREARADKRVGGTGQNRDRTLQSSPVVRIRLGSRPVKFPAELVDRPDGCQPGQQCRKNPLALTPAELQCRNKSFLKTVGSIRVVAGQSV